MEINDILLNALLEQAAESPRLRMNRDLRNSEKDQSQRMLNALLPGTVLSIHRHRNSSESVIILKGRITEIFFDDQGNEIESFDLDPLKGAYGVQIPIGQWHSIEVHEPSVIMESKDGAYEPQSEEDILKI